jgi:hypothetical protein
MKQTAVEWLVYVVQSNIAPNYIPKEIVKQAKEIEKQQIIDAHGIKKDYSFSQIDPQTITGEQYFNETFKNTKK